jgi:hypothetical protein
MLLPPLVTVPLQLPPLGLSVMIVLRSVAVLLLRMPPPSCSAELWARVLLVTVKVLVLLMPPP